MYTMYCDLTNKKISWKVKGIMDESEYRCFMNEMERNMEKMGHGFSFLIDLAESESFFPNHQEMFLHMIEACRKKGMKACACVLRDPDWVRKLTEKFATGEANTYEKFFISKTEAESFLNNEI